MTFGYATNETPELMPMPMPIALAHRLSARLAQVRKDGTLPYLRPDGKTQVTVRYRDNVPVAVEKVLISAQHADEVSSEQIRNDLWDQVVLTVLHAGFYDEAQLAHNLYVNPTGRFVIGGPVGDAGLTGRKIIVDPYGGFARHGGDAFSGKDPSKVDRYAAYAARYVAKTLLARVGGPRRSASGLRDRRRPAASIAGGNLWHRAIEKLVNEHFDLRPAGFRSYLGLHRPIYGKTAAYGHFGRDDPDFTWERTDKAAELREAVGLTATTQSVTV